MAVLYAVLCLLCSAGNDFLFKLFARKPRSRGIFCTLIGIFWTVLTIICFPVDFVTNWQATLVWGCIIGTFSIVANILLIEAMGFQSAGVCSTIYRLNLVPVVFGAWLLLGERVSTIHWIGICLAVAAVLCFMTISDTDRKNLKRAKLGLYMVILAALLRAGMGISYKYAFIHHADQYGFVVITGFFWIIGGLIYAFVQKTERVALDKSMLFYGGLSGIFVAGITLLMAFAVKYGDASITLPIAQMSFPVTFLLSILFLKERITVWKGLGVILSVGAVFLLCLP